MALGPTRQITVDKVLVSTIKNKVLGGNITHEQSAVNLRSLWLDNLCCFWYNAIVITFTSFCQRSPLQLVWPGIPTQDFIPEQKT
jgi:hypothetical protein